MLIRDGKVVAVHIGAFKTEPKSCKPWRRSEARRRARRGSGRGRRASSSRGCGLRQQPPDAVDLYGTVVDPPWTPGSGELTTTDGKPFSLAKDTTAPLTLIFFGYTHCPDICPAVLSLGRLRA